MERPPPYVGYEAEAGRYQGTLVKADAVRAFGHTNFASESSGRKSVRLDSAGECVEFTSTNASNSIVVRNSIPDAPGVTQVAPPAARPAECTSITECGAVPDDGNDDTKAVQAAVTADQNGDIACVWIPQGMRIRNTYADGINFTNGTRNSKVDNSSFRTTGDDSPAVWANRYVKDPAVDIAHDNSFTNNTIRLPWRPTASRYTAVGGCGNKVHNNWIADTANYPGIMLATDHEPLPFSGETLLPGNALHRTGGAFWDEGQEFGAITIFPASRDIIGVRIRDTEISDSTYDGIQFKNGGGNVPDVEINNVSIDRSNNGSGILAMRGAVRKARRHKFVIGHP
ncbi:hypothetical protein OG292_07375 [Streptomyces sp. NBC_01511]